MKSILLSLLMLILITCNSREYKLCDFESSDIHLKIYNDILNELVEQRFYQGYLGTEGDSLFRQYGYFSKTPDSLKLDKEIVSLQNRIFKDTTRFETICYRQELLYGPWTYYLSSEQPKKDTTREWNELRELMGDFSSNWKAVADTLATVQSKYSSQDFRLCTSKVIPYRQRKECGIGIVTFSKVIINDSKTDALLYYEFDCGGKCGFGEIILVEKFQGRWKIKKVNQLWIS